MATEIREILIPPMTRTQRVSRTLRMPVGAVVLTVFKPEGNGPFLIVRADPTQPFEDRNFSAVAKGVSLTPAEEAGTYVGTFSTTRIETGLEVFHLFAV